MTEMNTLEIVLIIVMVMLPLLLIGLFAGGILMAGADRDESRNQSSSRNDRLGGDSRDASPVRNS